MENNNYKTLEEIDAILNQRKSYQQNSKSDEERYFSDVKINQNKNKYRHELKYLISHGDKELILQRIKRILKPDPHAENGVYKIRSLYFDDYYNSAYDQKLMGIADRKKYRIRIYNDKDDIIKLECKIKKESFISKLSASLTTEEYMKIINGDYSFLLKRKENLCKQFYFELTSKVLRPRVIVDYDREPYLCRAGDVRITFDNDVRGCAGSRCVSLFDNSLPTIGVLEPGKVVMEVKFTEFLPTIVKKILPSKGAEMTAVSKFILCCEATNYLYAKTTKY